MGLDKRLLKSDPGPPKWLALQGFEECSRGNAAGTVNAYPSSVAPRGFALFSRFCRGLSVVLLGRNVDHNGDVVEGRKGEAAAMYFVVVVRVSEKEAVKEVDVGPVAMHRKLVKAVSDERKIRCMCVLNECVFINLHISTHSGPVILL